LTVIYVQSYIYKMAFNRSGVGPISSFFTYKNKQKMEVFYIHRYFQTKVDIIP